MRQKPSYVNFAFIVPLLVSQASSPAGRLPMTGTPNPAFKSFDDAVTKFMLKYEIPGGALAVTSGGKMIYARGYGWADVEENLPATPASLFRIASISKPITAVAVMTLVQDGKLKLDDHALHVLNLKPLTGAKEDPRLVKITVRQLLQHTGGWDRDKSGDPMFKSVEIAKVAGMQPPADQRAIIRYML